MVGELVPKPKLKEGVSLMFPAEEGEDVLDAAFGNLVGDIFDGEEELLGAW